MTTKTNEFVIGVEMVMHAQWTVGAESYQEAYEMIFDEEHPKYDEDFYKDGFEWHLHQLKPDMDTAELLAVDGEWLPWVVKLHETT